MSTAKLLDTEGRQLIRVSEKKIPKRIDPSRSDDESQKDLERYRLLAFELGATDAKIIKSNEVTVRNRVRGKCLIPLCEDYGQSILCPPHVPTIKEIMEIVNEYKYGIFIRLIVPSDQMAGKEAIEEDRMGLSRGELHEIVSNIESHAFYDGYHMAMGFAGGTCKRAFCPNVECNALAGKGCRHPLWARMSMESAGMDAFTMAAKVGWDIYPIGKEVSFEDVPHGNRLGLVLIY